MTDKRSKYDTDPLDPEFARRTGEVMGRAGGSAGEQGTEPLGHDSATSDPTRRFGEQISDTYPSVFVPPAYQSPPAQPRPTQRPTQPQPHGFTGFGAGAHQPPAPVRPLEPGPSSPYEPHARPSSRKVSKLGLAENVATVLPYAPFYIGLIASLVILLIAPREETRTRFHASQGLALQLAILAGSFALGAVGRVTGSGFGGFIFGLAAFVFLLVSMWRVWEGKPHHIVPLDDATAWLNQRVAPTK